MKYQDNQIITKLISEGFLSAGPYSIETSFELCEEIRAALSIKKMKVQYHFDAVSGKIIFDKVLGRDDNDDFYNEQNGNLEGRKEQLKKVIINVLVNKYNNLIRL